MIFCSILQTKLFIIKKSENRKLEMNQAENGSGFCSVISKNKTSFYVLKIFIDTQISDTLTSCIQAGIKILKFYEEKFLQTHSLTGVLMMCK